MNIEKYINYKPLGFDIVLKELEKQCYLDMTKERLDDLLEVSEGNLEFELEEISVYQKPNWFLDGIQILKELTEFSIKRDVNWKAMEILEFARKKTTQKVNLYEKVQIPEFNHQYQR